MRKPLYIYSSSNFCQGVEDELPSLKATLLDVCGKKIRRIDRLTQLALIGSFQCSSGFQLPERTGLYLSSIYGSLNNTGNVLREIYQNGQLPRPLSFINAVSNAACFYLAEQLGLLANNQFVSRDHFSFEAALKLASLDLELDNVEAALVGVVCEVGENLAVHRQRFQIADQYTLAEGSHWLYLAHDLPGSRAIAKITHLVEPLTETELELYLQRVLTESSGLAVLGFSDAVVTTQQERLQKVLNLSARSYSTKNYSTKNYGASYVPASALSTIRHEFSTARNICSFLEIEAEESPGCFIHLDTDANGRWSILVVEKCDRRKI